MKNVLVVDVGGSHVKVYMTGQSKVELVSGLTLTAQDMVSDVKRLTQGWQYQQVSVGYPGPVLHNRPIAEPHNLGAGWVGFDYAGAFERPVKVINDAAMQALGSYMGRKMLFLGFGTGLGSALVVNGLVEPMELGHLPYRKKTYEDYVGLRGLKKLGKKKWRKVCKDVIVQLTNALEPEEVVIGGGNASLFNKLPAHCRLGTNANAFLGGVRLWQKRR